MGKYGDNNTIKKDDEKKNLKENIQKIRRSTILKNFDALSQSIESSAIAQPVSHAPCPLDAYISIVIIDDDNNTRDSLQEDQGHKLAC